MEGKPFRAYDHRNTTNALIRAEQLKHDTLFMVPLLRNGITTACANVKAFHRSV